MYTDIIFMTFLLISSFSSIDKLILTENRRQSRNLIPMHNFSSRDFHLISQHSRRVFLFAVLFSIFNFIYILGGLFLDKTIIIVEEGEQMREAHNQQ